MFSLIFCWNIQSQKERNNCFLFSSLRWKDLERFYAQDAVERSPISLSFLRLKSLDGEEALKRGWLRRVHRHWGPRCRACEELCGQPLLNDAINLWCGGHLICLLSELSHCRRVVAIVCGSDLKKLGLTWWARLVPPSYALAFLSLSSWVVNGDWKLPHPPLLHHTQICR